MEVMIAVTLQVSRGVLLAVALVFHIAVGADIAIVFLWFAVAVGSIEFICSKYFAYGVLPWEVPIRK